MNVAAIVLAAGASKRLGQPKQLVQIAGETLLDRAVRLAVEAGCSPINVVLGASREQIEAECNLASALVLHNPDWAEGMASSIRCGVAATAPETGAVLVMTCDQLQVTASHLHQLIQLCEQHQEAVASEYDERHGVPACFLRRDFPSLLALRGDSGARDLLKGVRSVKLLGGSLDLDTPEDLRAALEFGPNPSGD